MKKLILLAIFTTTVLFIAGCEQKNPLSTDQNTNSVTILSKDQMSLNKLFSSSKWIDDDGGIIGLGDDQEGYSFLNFPEDALDDDDATTIFFSWESSELLQAKFGPHGIQFDKPVYIRLSYKGANLIGVNESHLRLYYYNELTQSYERLKSEANVNEKYVHGYLYNFSRYAIGYDN